jgi:NDP-sugar pyrophosphorylase family protein
MPPTKLIDHHVAKMAQTAFWHTIVGAGDLQSVADYTYARYANNPEVTALTTGEYPQLGTAGDLIVAVRDCPELFGEHVVIKNCDTVLDIEDREFVDFHVSRKSLVSIALTRKKGVPNEGAFFVDSGGKVVYSAEAEDNIRTVEEAHSITAMNASSTGALVIDTNFLRNVPWDPAEGQLSLYRDVMGMALQQDAVAGYDNDHRFFVDIGTSTTWLKYAQSPELQRYLCYDTEAETGEETVA